MTDNVVTVEALKEELRKIPSWPCCSDIYEGPCYCPDGYRRWKLKQAIEAMEKPCPRR